MTYFSSFKASVLCSALLCATVSAQTYEFTDLTIRSGDFSTAVSINNRGQIVGGANFSLGGDQFATEWNNAIGHALSTPVPFQAVAINDRGQIAGNVGGPLGPFSEAGSTARAALMDQNGLTVFHGFQARAQGSQALGINNRGEVVGYAQTLVPYEGYPTSLTTHAALFSVRHATVDLGTLGGTNSFGYAVNNRSQAVGLATASGDFNTAPALFHGGTVTSLGGWSAHDINDRGLVVGSSFRDLAQLGSDPVFVEVATAFKPSGESVYLDNTLNLSGASVAKAVNGSGLAVGYAKQSFYGVSHGTLWANGAQIDLNDYLAPSLLAAGWYIRAANDINDAGWIVGDLYNTATGAQHGFLLSISAVPEPGTPAYWLAGAALIAWRLRSRRQP